jgi:hypothetical protein
MDAWCIDDKKVWHLFHELCPYFVGYFRNFTEVPPTEKDKVCPACKVIAVRRIVES